MMSLRTTAAAQLVLLGGLTACGTSSTTSTTQTSAALETAQCTFQANRAAADACFATFKTCVSAENADAAACATALQSCLPLPPAPPDGGIGEGPGPGRGHEGHGGPGGPGGAGGCQGMDGGEGHGGRGGHGGPGPRPEPDAAAITACHDALTSCLAATPGDSTCFDTEHACEKAAFDAAFAQVCASASTCDAATDPACANLQRHCAEGVDGRPAAFDGGTCQ